MQETLEAAATAPTAYETRRDAYNGLLAMASVHDEALYLMLAALHAELADEREIVRAQGAVIGALQHQVANTRRTVDWLRLSETRVEWSGIGEPDEDAIEKALLTAFHLGQREATLRNAPQPADDEGGEG